MKFNTPNMDVLAKQGKQPSSTYVGKCLGMDAYLHKQSISDNPFEEGTAVWAAWDKGWLLEWADDLIVTTLTENSGASNGN